MAFTSRRSTLQYPWWLGHQLWENQFKEHQIHRVWGECTYHMYPVSYNKYVTCICIRCTFIHMYSFQRTKKRTHINQRVPVISPFLTDVHSFVFYSKRWSVAIISHARRERSHLENSKEATSFPLSFQCTVNKDEWLSEGRFKSNRVYPHHRKERKVFRSSIICREGYLNGRYSCSS
jgi:predicted nucleic-acid-binding Zn-ribbon protein